MNQYQLIIFDWDGTLMDSIGRIVSSLQCAAETIALPIPDTESAKSIIGLSLTKAAQVLFPDSSESQQEQLAVHYKKQFRELNATPMPLFEHTVELLELLSQQQRLLAVATGKARAGLDHVLAESQIAHYFHDSICSDEALSKPDPAMLNILLKRLNVSPENALMIGDSIHDLNMANSAGMDSVGITLGASDRDILASCQPKYLVDSIKELYQLFDN